MVVSQDRGPQYRPQHTAVLIRGVLQNGPLFLGGETINPVYPYITPTYDPLQASSKVALILGNPHLSSVALEWRKPSHSICAVGSLQRCKGNDVPAYHFEHVQCLGLDFAV